MTESSYLSTVFDIVDGFLRSAVVGQFPMRLHLVRLFCLQLLQDLAPPSAGVGVGGGASSAAAATASLSSQLRLPTQRDLLLSGVGGNFSGGDGMSDTASVTSSGSLDPRAIKLRQKISHVVFGIWQVSRLNARLFASTSETVEVKR